VGSLRPIRTAHKTLGGRTFEHPSCGGFMPTAETTLIPALGNQRAVKRSLTSDARLDNEPNFFRGTPGRLHITASTAPAEVCAERGSPYSDAMHKRRITVYVELCAERGPSINDAGTA
jgi:hypothetical protein